jgi:RNA polymerase sigma-70 factor (ECF subfamily)
MLRMTASTATWQDVAAKLRPYVARRVSPSDIDDVMQDIFVRMQRGLAALRDDERYTSWLFQIARSAIADLHRARARHPLVAGEPEELADPATVIAPTADVVSATASSGSGGNDRHGGSTSGPGSGGGILTGSDDDREATRMLASCISLFVAQLPSPYREAVTLVELEGLTAREAAAMAGISVSGMKSRVQRGRAQLRTLFDECCEIALDVRGKVTDFTPRTPRCPACRTGNDPA